MNPKVKELRQKRAAIVQEMHDLTEKTGFPQEAQKRYKELDAEQEGLKLQIETIERQEKLDTEMRTMVPAVPGAQPIADPAAGGTRTLTAVSNEAETRQFFSEDQKKYFEMRNSQEYRKAFWAYTRARGSSKPDPILDECLVLEARTYAGLGDASSSADGYYLVPIGFQREIEKRMISFGGMRRNSRVLNTSTGNVLNWPTADDTANVGNWVAEAAAVSQVNPTFANVQFNAYLASSKQVLVSVQLLQDSAFDLESYLAEAFAIRIARIANNGYTVGSGSGQPNGILTAIEADGSPLIVTAVGSTNNDGGASEDGSNSIGSDDLANLIAELDPMYRVGAKFMMHWSVIDYLRKLKDKYGRPLWEVSIAQGTPDRIYGYEYDWNADMSAWTQGAGESGANASLYTILFGQFSKYIVREIGGITMVRFNELYMPNHQVGFQAFLRTDGQRIQQSAFSLLKQASS
jgi:HK97 family phage major capsid protein